MPTIAIRALRNHYARKERPHAEAIGISRAEILPAAHRALDREFERAWPASPDEKFEQGEQAASRCAFLIVALALPSVEKVSSDQW